MKLKFWQVGDDELKELRISDQAKSITIYALRQELERLRNRNLFRVTSPDGAVVTVKASSVMVEQNGTVLLSDYGEYMPQVVAVFPQGTIVVNKTAEQSLSDQKGT